MRKTILVSLTIVSLFMTGCGCGKKLEKKVCKMKEIEENYELNSTVTLEYDTKNNKMLSFEENSALTSDKQEILDNFIAINNDSYTSYGEHYDSFIDGNKAQMNIKIDFDEITTDQFIELDSINESFITDGNVDYTKIIDYYNQFTNYECD